MSTNHTSGFTSTTHIDRLGPTHPVGLQYNATKDGVFLIQSAIAQWIARRAFNPNVECSIPSSHTQSQ